eukprot:CAMPEP_0198282518 /NCGR_PEP_ID=MMETSP1449-20131203/2308_1 /TAXON_ID=420275 /ORGANISM="Attheya septentrionalis, Strain CCMP2084" /LENGTH=580 /DNA_ID=CAMNT_0043978789 /DNA_START=8 /DNA_END=1748 /DNA_ORIENTATION=+
MESSWSSTRTTSAQEAMGSSSSSSSSSSGRIINCPDCGKRVPALNLELHQMRGQCLQTDIPVATPVPVAGTAVPLYAGAGPHSHMKTGSSVPNNSSSSRSSHAMKVATDHSRGSGTYQNTTDYQHQHQHQHQQKQEDDTTKRRSWLPPSLRRRRPRPNGSSPGGPDRYSSRASPSYVGNSSVSTYGAGPSQRMPSDHPPPPPHPSSHSGGSLYASNHHQHPGPTSSYSSYVDMTEEDPTEKDDHEVLHVRDVVNLADKYDSSDDDEDDDSSMQAEWACPRCTLLNPFPTDSCEACQYSNPVHGSSTEQPSDETSAHSSLVNVVRNPDPVRRERLIDDDYVTVDHQHHQQPSSSWDQNSGPTVGAGAILGTVLGAAGALVRGRNVGSGALHGAVQGAVGGAIVDQVFRDRNPMPPRRSHSMGPNALRPPPTRHYQSHHTSTTTAEGTDMMHMLLNSIMINGEQGRGYGQRVAHPDVDGMSYEQLLQVFGDGTRENRGAEPAVIASLPSQTIQNVERELPEDKRSCHICLEDFTSGDTRRTLPCLMDFMKDASTGGFVPVPLVPSANTRCPNMPRELPEDKR